MDEDIGTSVVILFFLVAAIIVQLFDKFLQRGIMDKSEYLVKQFWFEPVYGEDHHKYECLVMKHPFGHYLSYASVSENSPLYGVSGQIAAGTVIESMFSEESVDDILSFKLDNFPQGITYYDSVNPLTDEEDENDKWWIGTDYVNWMEKSEKEVIEGALALAILIHMIDSVTSQNFSHILQNNMLEYTYENACWKKEN